MNDQNKERLSAFMDDEIDLDNDVLQQLKNSDEAKAVWARYHLIRDAMTQHLGEQVKVDLVDRVSSALIDEPVVLAPRRQPKKLAKVLKPVSGMAIAASIGANSKA